MAAAGHLCKSNVLGFDNQHGGGRGPPTLRGPNGEAARRCPGLLSSRRSPRLGRPAMLASRVARASWGTLRVAAWAPGVRPGKGRARGAVLPAASCCLGCLAERWWLRPTALGLRLPGTGPRAHCSGSRKAAPGSAAGEDVAAEARSGRWGPASAPSLVRTEEEAEGRLCVGVVRSVGAGFRTLIPCSDPPRSMLLFQNFCSVP